MAKGRGRKSSGETTFGTGPIVPGALPEPPPDLAPDAQAIWRATVSGLPYDWFAAGGLALLKLYCEHCSYADEIDRSITTLRKKFIAEGRDPLTDLQYIKLTGQLQRRQALQSRHVMSLAAKLHLTKSSRYMRRSDAAGSGSRDLTGALMPWEDWGRRQ